jgi:dTDP-4-amino-4,6-dideoxygalactose transaminase
VIPFNRPTIAPRQTEFVAAAFDSRHLAGDGAFTEKAAAELSAIHEGATVLLTTSCTAALELSAMLLGIEPGDEIIVPSFTFVSSANAFVVMGARIVFVDIDPETLNLDETQVAAALTDRTKAVVAVNYGGVASVSKALIDMAARVGAIVIEDNAHGLFGSSDGQPLGALSALSTLSFHETKNVTCGEGGALVINDDRFVERAEVLREKGTNRSRFFRGMVDKYTWMDIGSSYLLSDVNAAILLAQLENAETIQNRRLGAVDAYRAGLEDWAISNKVRLQVIPDGCVPPAHLFCLLMPDLAERTRFLAFTRDRGVGTTFHYLPLHSSPAGRRFGSAPFGCPNSNDIADRLVRLPVFSDISEAEITHVVEVVNEFSRQ